MSKHGVTDAVTNTKEGSKAKVDYCCDTLWSMVQEKVYERLSDREGDHLTLIENYAVRARRIAGTYARLYLETEEGGDPSKKGRFYWMALGAFASKTVSCALDLKRVAAQDIYSGETIEGLGKGNFWLFQDVSAWHWYYTLNNNSFDMCAPKRNASHCAVPVKRCLNTLPWGIKALPTINYMSITPEIRAGFAKVKTIEGMDKTDELRADIQLEHLLDIANHEQLNILQPLIYDDYSFSKWLERSRSAWLSWASPDLELVFAHTCETDNPLFKSKAPEGIVLEDEDSRMRWIEKAAETFHGLMKENPAYMEGELQTIASWYNDPDEFYAHKYIENSKEGLVKATENVKEKVEEKIDQSAGAVIDTAVDVIEDVAEGIADKIGEKVLGNRPKV